MKREGNLHASLIYILERLSWIEQNALVGWATGDMLFDYNAYNSVLRDLQTLSEEVSKLPTTFKELYPEVPWKQIAGFRNILVHDYMGTISPAIIESVISDHLPDIKIIIIKHLAILNEE